MSLSCRPDCLRGTPLWNLYDVTENNPEFCLYESVVGEYTDIAGFPVQYYRAISNTDRLYGEDANQDFLEPLETKLVYEPTEEPMVINSWGGPFMDETVQYTLIPKSIFTRDIGEGDVDIVPAPGDVIKTLWNNRNYEIVDIGSEQNIFMGKKLIWEFILRPFRFSEQSDKADQIHGSTVEATYYYIYPDGIYADVTYPDGSSETGVLVDDLDLGINLECGFTYRKNDDHSIDIIKPTVVLPTDQVPHPEYGNTGLPLEDNMDIAYGDNSWIEVESDAIDDYGDVDDSIFNPPIQDVVFTYYGVVDSDTLVQADLLNLTSIATPSTVDVLQYDATGGGYVYYVTPSTVDPITFEFNNFEMVLVLTTDTFTDNTGNPTVYQIYRTQYRQTSSDITLTVTRS